MLLSGSFLANGRGLGVASTKKSVGCSGSVVVLNISFSISEKQAWLNPSAMPSVILLYFLENTGDWTLDKS